ncbi:MAG: hypothetical protein HY791_30275 [Deltaproteobacteria bacterium]|nr:hypothetical protein [Deltaproteobacteria bacterium]
MRPRKPKTRALLGSIALLGGNICCGNVALIEAPPGSRLIVAFGDAEGVGAVETGTGALVDLELRSETIAAVFVISPEDLMGPSGQPISAQELATAEFLPARALPRPDACAGCLAPTVGDQPLIVHPGDRCSLFVSPRATYRGPGLVEDELQPAQVETLTLGTELRWPGSCPVPSDPKPTEGLRLTTCPILPEGSPESYYGTDMDERGNILRVGEHQLLGSRPGAPSSNLTRDLQGPFRVVVRAPDGDGFLLVTSDLGAAATSGSRWERVRLGDEAIEVTSLPVLADMLPSKIQTFGDKTYVGGGVRSHLGGFQPAIATCDGIACRRASFDSTAECGYGGRGSSVSAFARTSSTVFAIGQRGGILAWNGEQFSCRADEHDAARSEPAIPWPGGGLAFWTHVLAAQAVADRVYVCGAALRQNVRVGVLASFDAADPTLTVTSTDAHDCQSLAVLPGASEVTATFRGRALTLDADGIVSSTPLGTGPDALFPELGRPMDSLLVAGDWILALGNDEHTVQRRAPTGELEKIAETQFVAGETVVAQTGPSQLTILRTDAPSLELEVGATCAQTHLSQRSKSLPPLTADSELLGATAAADGRILVFGSVDGFTGYVALSNADGSWSATRLDGFAPVRSAAEILDGRFVLAHGNAISILEASDLSASPLELVFDDPRTAPVERPAADSNASFLRVTASAGIAWVGGDRALVRVEPTRGGALRGVAFWYSTYIADLVTDLTARDTPKVSFLSGRIPSHLDFTVDLAPTVSEFSSRSDIFRLIPARAECDGSTKVGGDGLITVCRALDPTVDFERTRAAAGLIRGQSGLLLVGVEGRVVNPVNSLSFRIGQTVRNTYDLEASSFVVTDGLHQLAAVVGR